MLANPLIMTTDADRFITLYNNGKQNNTNPAALLAYVCRDEKVRYLANPIPSDRKRNKAIAPTHQSIHCSQVSNGINISSIINMKIKSAILSRISPNLLAASVFLATYPSKISLIPHRRYTTKNCRDSGSISNNENAPIILPVVIKFAVCLILSPLL